MNERFVDKFNVPLSIWKEAIIEIGGLLRRYAKVGRTIDYTTLCKLTRAIRLEPDEQMFREILGEIGEAEVRDKRPVITSIVTQRSGTREPGSGFFVYHLKRLQKIDREVGGRRVNWSLKNLQDEVFEFKYS